MRLAVSFVSAVVRFFEVGGEKGSPELAAARDGDKALVLARAKWGRGRERGCNLLLLLLLLLLGCAEAKHERGVVDRPVMGFLVPKRLVVFALELLLVMFPVTKGGVHLRGTVVRAIRGKSFQRGTLTHEAVFDFLTLWLWAVIWWWCGCGCSRGASMVALLSWSTECKVKVKDHNSWIDRGQEKERMGWISPRTLNQPARHHEPFDVGPCHLLFSRLFPRPHPFLHLHLHCAVGSPLNIP